MSKDRAVSQVAGGESCMSDQVPTRAVRTEWIIGRAAFRSGVEDVRAGRAPRFDDFNDNDAWSYERGRLFAVLAPVSMPLKIDGECNRKRFVSTMQQYVASLFSHEKDSQAFAIGDRR
jgi:hypothetical protein